MIAFLLACGDAPAEETAAPGDTGGEPAVCEGAPAVTWESWGEGFFTTWCQPCHSATTPDRSGAPEGVDFDTEAEVVRWSAAIQQTVAAGSMPVGGGLSEEDLTLLEVLLTCGL